jgi:protein-S-isoprenylcysteine O-methyltransferase Ste14
MSSERDHAGVIAPPPLIFLSGLLAGFVLDALLPSTQLPAARIAGAVLLLAGLGLIGWFIAMLRGAGTAVEPWKRTTALVTDGPYRLTRNPGYLGMALVYAGIALLAQVWWALATLVVVLVVVDRGVIAREERYLVRLFGAEYEDYRRRVRRWV